MTFLRIVAGMKSCIEDGDSVDEIVVTKSFKDEILVDNKYATPSDDLGSDTYEMPGYSITVGEANYILSESGEKYEIPDEA